MKSAKWPKLRRLAWISGGLVALFLLDYWLYPVFAQPANTTGNRGENGLWLRYTWYFGNHTPSEVSALASQLARAGISDAFFHVRSIDSDGRLRYRYLPQAQTLNVGLHRDAPKVRRIAWIYVGNENGKGHVDLRSSEVRRNMEAEAVWLVRDAGFDGVQWDYEICPDGDPSLLSLIKETRAALPKGAYLGVAAPGWYPWPITSEGWSPGYLHQVAALCDSVAVMAYDSGMFTPRAYVWWVGQQVVEATTAADGTGCKVLIGIPTYRDGTLSHNPRAENLRLALTGVRDGLANQPALSAWQGVALFADYTTTDADWQEFGRLWPQK